MLLALASLGAWCGSPPPENYVIDARGLSEVTGFDVTRVRAVMTDPSPPEGMFTDDFTGEYLIEGRGAAELFFIDDGFGQCVEGYLVAEIPDGRSARLDGPLCAGEGWFSAIQ